MAAKTPDSVSMRYDQGSQSMFILTFNPTTIATGDTVDLSPYCSTILNADFMPDTGTAGVSTGLSGTGNITATINLSVGTPTGRLVIWGNP